MYTHTHNLLCSSCVALISMADYLDNWTGVIPGENQLSLNSHRWPLALHLGVGFCETAPSPCWRVIPYPDAILFRQTHGWDHGCNVPVMSRSPDLSWCPDSRALWLFPPQFHNVPWAWGVGDVSEMDPLGMGTPGSFTLCTLSRCAFPQRPPVAVRRSSLARVGARVGATPTCVVLDFLR